MKIYTKTGDKGATGLIGGTRVQKSDIRLEAYGTVDELNCHIGLLVCHCTNKEDTAFLQNIQNILFTVGAQLATDTSKSQYNAASTIQDKWIESIETEIDKMTESLLKLTNFTIPGGSVASAESQICRTIARRAERCIVKMTEEQSVENNLLVYVNRLSDYFYTLARKLLMEENVKEILWDLPK